MALSEPAPSRVCKDRCTGKHVPVTQSTLAWSGTCECTMASAPVHSSPERGRGSVDSATLAETLENETEAVPALEPHHDSVRELPTAIKRMHMAFSMLMRPALVGIASTTKNNAAAVSAVSRTAMSSHKCGPKAQQERPSARCLSAQSTCIMLAVLMVSPMPSWNTHCQVCKQQPDRLSGSESKFWSASDLCAAQVRWGQQPLQMLVFPVCIFT